MTTETKLSKTETDKLIKEFQEWRKNKVTKIGGIPLNIKIIALSEFFKENKYNITIAEDGSIWRKK